MLYHLRELTASGAIPTLPVYVDSPMALSALRLYRATIERNGVDIRDSLAELGDPFDSQRITEVRDVEESKALAGLHGPAIIVSASGMATGGRVVHHLARLLPDRRNTVLLVGFQAPGHADDCSPTAPPTSRCSAGMCPCARTSPTSRASPSTPTAPSSGRGSRRPARDPEVVYLVHGEPAASAALRGLVTDTDGLQVVIPRHAERVRLD